MTVGTARRAWRSHGWRKAICEQSVGVVRVTAEDVAKALAQRGRATVRQLRRRLVTHGPTPRGMLRHLPRVLVEARPQVQGIVALRLLTGLAVLGPLTMDHVPVVLSWVLATVAIYVLNGVSDIAGDRLNGSNRPLARGVLPPRVATAWVVTAAVLSFSLAVREGASFAAAVCVYVILGVVYSIGPHAAKGSSIGAGATVVAAGVLTYAAAALASGRPVSATLVVFGISMSLWMAVGSLVKDLTDLTGDVAAGRQTLGVRRGANAVIAAAALLSISICIITATCAVALRTPGLGALAVFLALGTSWLVAELTVFSSSDRRAPYRSFMSTQYGSHGVLLTLG